MRPDAWAASWGSGWTGWVRRTCRPEGRPCGARRSVVDELVLGDRAAPDVGAAAVDRGGQFVRGHRSERGEDPVDGPGQTDVVVAPGRRRGAVDGQAEQRRPAPAAQVVLTRHGGPGQAGRDVGRELGAVLGDVGAGGPPVPQGLGGDAPPAGDAGDRRGRPEQAGPVLQGVRPQSRGPGPTRSAGRRRPPRTASPRG